MRKKSVGYDFSGGLRLSSRSTGRRTSALEALARATASPPRSVHYPVLDRAAVHRRREWAADDRWGDLVASSPRRRAGSNFVEFRFEDDGAAPVSFHVNEVAAVPQPGTGVVSDRLRRRLGVHLLARPARPRHATATAPTAVIIRDLVGTANYRDPAADCRRLQTDSGWDIAAHADTVADHNAGFANLEDPVVEADMQGIKRWLIDNGFKRRDLFAWPQGSFTASQMIIARRFFNGIRGTTGGSGGAAGPHETFPPGDNGRLRTWVIGVGETAADVETALSQCNTHRSWLILSFHEIVASGAEGGLQTNEATFKAMVDKDRRQRPRRQDRRRGPGELEDAGSGGADGAAADQRPDDRRRLRQPAALDLARARSGEAAIVATVSRLQWQPSPRKRQGFSSRSCQRARPGSSARTCSRKSSRPPGLSTRAISASAAAGSGTVQRTRVDDGGVEAGVLERQPFGRRFDRPPPSRADSPPASLAAACAMCGSGSTRTSSSTARRDRARG